LQKEIKKVPFVPSIVVKKDDGDFMLDNPFWVIDVVDVYWLQLVSTKNDTKTHWPKALLLH